MVQKLHSFYFRKLQLITVLLLISDTYMSRSTTFVSLKMWVGFSIFNSVLFLLTFVFLLDNTYGLSDFKTLQPLSKFKE